MLNSLTNLEVYKASRAFRKNISDLVKTQFPVEEKTKLNDQIIRSSRGITACIAEGYGRFNYQETIQYFRMARGSLIETLEHLIVAYDEKYITKETLLRFKEEGDKCTRLLNGYVKYLKEKKGKNDNKK
jgi:four helix bundle protein